MTFQVGQKVRYVGNGNPRHTYTFIGVEGKVTEVGPTFVFAVFPESTDPEHAWTCFPNELELIKEEKAVKVNPQIKKVLQLMLQDGKITRLTAMHYGIANVTARIADIRKRLRIYVDCQEKVDADGHRYGLWFIPFERDRSAAADLIA